LAASKFVTMIFGIWQSGAYAMAADGLITIPSSFGPKETMDRLEAEIKAKGMTVFARIDHAAGAEEVGLPLRPTELLIFGNAKAGTPLMQANQPIGIDLPLKALVFENAAGRVWLSYNDPRWLAQRHGVGPSLSLSMLRPPRSTLLRQKQRSHPDAEKPFTKKKERHDSSI
jgi:uncharacterized protein (DUF302 family)